MIPLSDLLEAVSTASQTREIVDQGCLDIIAATNEQLSDSSNPTRHYLVRDGVVTVFEGYPSAHSYDVLLYTLSGKLNTIRIREGYLSERFSITIMDRKYEHQIIQMQNPELRFWYKRGISCEIRISLGGFPLDMVCDKHGNPISFTTRGVWSAYDKASEDERKIFMRDYYHLTVKDCDPYD